MYPAVVKSLRVCGELIAAARTVFQCVERCFSGEHAGFHRGVGAFDLGHVQRSRFTPDQDAARENELRQALQSALVQCARTVGNATAALECGKDFGVGLEALEFVEGADPRIAKMIMLKI